MSNDLWQLWNFSNLGSNQDFKNQRGIREISLHNPKLAKFLRQKLDATVALNHPSQGPHVTAIWVVEFKDKLYFSTETTRKKYPYLQSNSKATISIVKHGGGYISVSGSIKIRTRDDFPEFTTVKQLIAKKYVDEARYADFVHLITLPRTRILVELTPENIYPS